MYDVHRPGVCVQAVPELHVVPSVVSSNKNKVCNR